MLNITPENTAKYRVHTFTQGADDSYSKGSDGHWESGDSDIVTALNTYTKILEWNFLGEEGVPTSIRDDITARLFKYRADDFRLAFFAALASHPCPNEGGTISYVELPGEFVLDHVEGHCYLVVITRVR
jgi:hypothetical protein